MREAVEVRCLVIRFRARARAEREAVSGYWTNLADDLERRLLREQGWTR